MVSGAISGTVGEAFDAFNDNRDDGNQSLGERIGAVGVNSVIAGVGDAAITAGSKLFASTIRFVRGKLPEIKIDKMAGRPKENIEFKVKEIEEPHIEGTGNGADVTKGYDVTAKYSSNKERLDRTPKNNGTWGAERGESKFVSEKPEVKQYLDEAGVDGVEYKNAIPDFSPFTKGEVKIPNMTNDRRKNFANADETLANQWSTPEKKWTADDVADWRDDNNYTWHELNDLESMQLVPGKINGTFNHLGGVGEHNIKEKLGE